MLESIAIPEVENLRISFGGGAQLKLVGTIALKDPSERLAPFFRKVHDAVCEGRVRMVRVDVSALTFVNSSAIRLFVDWATWVGREPEDRRYELRFLTDRSITWQRTSFAALESLARGVVSVEHLN